MLPYFDLSGTHTNKALLLGHSYQKEIPFADLLTSDFETFSSAFNAIKRPTYFNKRDRSYFSFFVDFSRVVII